MKAFLAALMTDVRLLYRTGYVHGVVVVLALLLVLLLQVSKLDFAGFADIVTAIVLIDQAASCLLLVGLMILLERGEGILTAMAVTPMPRAAYIAAKVIAVSAISGIQTCLLVLIAYDGAVSFTLLLAGLFGMAAIITLLGMMAVAPVDTLFRFLLPMIGWVLFLSLPGYGVLFGWQPAWLDFHPMSPPLALLEAAFEDASRSGVTYGAAGTLVWLCLATVGAVISLGIMRGKAAGA